jgi:hypothetical protein
LCTYTGVLTVIPNRIEQATCLRQLQSQTTSQATLTITFTRRQSRTLPSMSPAGATILVFRRHYYIQFRLPRRRYSRCRICLYRHHPIYTPSRGNYTHKQLKHLTEILMLMPQPTQQQRANKSATISDAGIKCSGRLWVEQLSIVRLRLETMDFFG